MLEPIVFIIFVNNMPEIVYTMIQMFAGDPKIFSEIKGTHDCDQLQDDLKALEDWSNEWILRFNAGENAKSCNSGKTQGEFTCMMMKDDRPVEHKTTVLEKDLGVHLNLPLIFSVHGK